MQIQPINADSTLFSITDAFSKSIVDQLNTLVWTELPCRSNDTKYRSIITLPYLLEEKIRQHAVDVIFPVVEQAKNIKFKKINDFSLICWINHPGFRSGVHTDGTVPATMQIFWEPSGNADWGTCFCNSININDVLHYFPSIQNTGYFTLAKTAQHPLWHGTAKPLSPGVLRISLMFVLGDYTAL